jgi:hypothetical protein
MKRLLFVVIVSATWIHAATALTTRQGTQRPSFEDFRVTQVFRGRPVPPVLDTPKARAFRTELRRQAASGPNFAGHFTVALWGCGAGCTDVAIIDARSGQVWFASFSYEDAWQDGRIVCPHAADFELSSELFIVRGDVNGKIGQHYYRWHDRKFTLLQVDEHCGDWTGI